MIEPLWDFLGMPALSKNQIFKAQFYFEQVFRLAQHDIIQHWTFFKDVLGMHWPSKTFFYTISALQGTVLYLSETIFGISRPNFRQETRPIVPACQIAHACKNYFFSVQEAAPTKLIKNADFVNLPNFL